MIQLKNVTKKYLLGDNPLFALNGITTDIKEGEYVSVIGPSGSGKSTLLHVMGGLESIDNGEIWIDGEPIHQMKESQLARIRKEKIGFIFQQFNLLPTASALENVMMPLLNFRSSTKVRKKAEDVLERVGLKDRMNHLPSRLSGGEQQRVAIARALITNPKIILADEPTGNLDSENGMKIIQILEELHKEEKVTIVIVTHDLSISSRAQREIRILDGKIIA
jgi:putative ABC transport system ATP-binding protein